jgi:hypothetical protein
MQEDLQPTTKKPLKISSWKLASGGVLIALGIFNFIPRGPESLRPSNESEACGYFAFSAVTILVGLIFVIAGIRALWLNPRN